MMEGKHFVDVQIIEEGILCAEWHHHAIISKESINDEFYQRQSLSKKPHSLLVKLHGIQWITEEAWEIISSDSFNSVTTALAIVHDEEAGYFEYGKMVLDLRRSMGGTFDYPVETFDDENSAITWLRSLKKEK